MDMWKRKQDISQAFRGDSQLQQFFLTDVNRTGKVLGSGSYGSVEEVSYKHLICAGKKIHETLIDVENEGVAEVVRKYLQECQLMSSLRHPNITQFLGLCFLPGTQLPLLVMERLETSLDDLLEHMLNLPLSLKISILEDVAHGLLYLHDRQSPIIHRDLTSKNVLLTSSFVAKLTDMGNSRIVTMKPGQMARTLTKYPGTLVYMPPEAQDKIHCYGTAMDIFSFGHLALYTLTQMFPGELLPSTYPNPDNPREVRGRTEVERREVYIQLLYQFISNHSALMELVKQCLQNDPNERPSTEQLLTALQKIGRAIEGEYGRGLVTLDLAKLKMAKELKKRDQIAEELAKLQARHDEMKRNEEVITKRMEESEKRLEELQEEIQANQMKARNDLLGKDVEIAMKHSQLEEKDKQIQVLEQEILNKSKEISALTEKTQDVVNEIEELKAENQVKDEEFKAKERDLMRLKAVQVSALQVLLNSWETDRQSIKLIKNLTQAEHSTLVDIWEGTWKGTSTVTVKVGKKPGVLLDEEFLQDAVVMTRLQHSNIVQLLAVCWEDNQSPIIITELMKLGCLDAFLRKDEGRCLELSQLINMCEQIASGMAFMELQGYVHCDLAARRILLTENLTCKVGSFYSAYSNSRTCTDHRIRYSARWSPPEVSIGHFSTKTDVWAFGIVLFEVITFGQLPYSDMFTSEVIPKVKQGFRMPKPDSCPYKLYEIMLDCWEKEPSSRPTFLTLQSRLQSFFTGKDQESTTKLSKANEEVVLQLKTKGWDKPTLDAGKSNLTTKDSQLETNEVNAVTELVTKGKKDRPVLEEKYVGVTPQLEENNYLEVLQAKNEEISSMKAQIGRLKGQLKRSQATLQNAVLKKWDTDQVRLVKKLGSTSFAITWEGIWKDSTEVTIKVHQPGFLPISDFLQDAVVMTDLRHPNILQLLAVCLKKQLIISELVMPENLLDYLRKSGRSLKQPQLFNMCQQIASGMAYMESQNYIHCDLAARNILLTEKLVCKVANFFLADTIPDEEIYIATTSTKYPIKWSPPEVFVANRYTSTSDIWSFGVVLYEVITYGQAPYIGMSNSDVMLKVQEGYRLPKPSTCPYILYEMMQNCWEEEPESRPTFQALQSQLESFTKIGLTVQTLHPFRAAKSGDLSFDADEIITNVEQVEPTGWWRGKRDLNGSQGYFPSNYVKLI